MSKNKIFIGSDHGGFQLKENLKKWLDNLGYEFEDMGAHNLDPEDDYPVFAFSVATKVAFDQNSLGILLCRSGGGMVIAANKVKNIRAVEIHDKKSAVHARQDNDANVVSLSADWLEEDQVKEVILAFLESSFGREERHQRRISKIKEFENEL